MGPESGIIFPSLRVICTYVNMSNPNFVYPSPAQCFSTLPVKSGDMISGSYEISGTPEGMISLSAIIHPSVEVVVSLTHPTSDVPVWSSRVAADHFRYSAVTPGQFKLCFKQSSPRGKQTASFTISTAADDYFEDRFTNLASKSQAEKVGILANQLEYKVSELLDQQDYAITRESIHRRTAEDTNEKLVHWTIAQVLVLLSIAFVQIYYLKSTFEIKLIA